jgi:hypothetical protein
MVGNRGDAIGVRLEARGASVAAGGAGDSCVRAGIGISTLAASKATKADFGRGAVK